MLREVLLDCLTASLHHGDERACREIHTEGMIFVRPSCMQHRAGLAAISAIKAAPPLAFGLALS